MIAKPRLLGSLKRCQARSDNPLMRAVDSGFDDKVFHLWGRKSLYSRENLQILSFSIYLEDTFFNLKEKGCDYDTSPLASTFLQAVLMTETSFEKLARFTFKASKAVATVSAKDREWNRLKECRVAIDRVCSCQGSQRAITIRANFGAD